MNPNFDLTGVVVFELAEAGPVPTADDFIRVAVQVFSRKGLPLGPSKVHRF
jgi:hypothetical protein